MHAVLGNGLFVCSHLRWKELRYGTCQGKCLLRIDYSRLLLCGTFASDMWRRVFHYTHAQAAIFGVSELTVLYPCFQKMGSPQIVSSDANLSMNLLQPHTQLILYLIKQRIPLFVDKLGVFIVFFVDSTVLCIRARVNAKKTLKILKPPVAGLRHYSVSTDGNNQRVLLLHQVYLLLTNAKLYVD